MRTFAFAAFLATTTALDATKFVKWAMEHGKFYETEDEFQMRHINFMRTEAAVQVLNDQDNGATFAHNEFSDYSDEEYKQMLGRWEIPENEEIQYSWLPESSNSSSVDWRKHGAVTDVKNQRQCGSCWAFSSTGAMEGAHQIKSGKLVSLSEQQFVDCSKRNGGCNGGNQDTAFKYAESNPIMLESDYKYTARDGSCKSSQHKGKVSVSGYKYVPNNSPSQLKSAVARQPVAVSIDASGRAFNNYSSGILSSGCGTRIDHAVLLVGWGKSGNQEYWIVKNSWGKSWGENGYIRMEIQSGKGVCGIQSADNCYPSTN